MGIGIGGNYGRMMRAQERAANVWRERAADRRDRTPAEWSDAVLDDDDARCGECGASEAERPLVLSADGHVCGLCEVSAPATSPSRTAWTRAGLVAAWSLAMVLAVVWSLSSGSRSLLVELWVAFGWIPLFVASCMALGSAWSLAAGRFSAFRFESDPAEARVVRARHGLAALAAATSGGAGLLAVLGVLLVLVA